MGLLTVIILSAKNAILIIEFSNELHKGGMALMEATLEATRMRLRPIVMTSLAFVFGVLLMTSSQGAGSASQHAVGTGVIGGMLSSTFLAIFFIPLFYVLIPLTSGTPPAVSMTVVDSTDTEPHPRNIRDRLACWRCALNAGPEAGVT